MARRATSLPRGRRGRFGTSARHSGGSGNLIWIALLCVSVAALGAGGYAYVRVAGGPALDPETLCPPSPPAALAVLVDASRLIGPTGAAQLRSAIDRAILEMPLTSEVTLGFVSGAAADWGPRVRACRPPTREEVDPRIGNPRLAEERFRTRFHEPLERALESVVGTSTAGTAQATVEDRLGGIGAGMVDTGSELLVTLPEALTFATGSAELEGTLLAPLAAVARALAAEGGTTVTVVGHSDSTGTREMNERLSLARAGAVADVLASGGLPSTQISVRGEADGRPIASNETSEGRAANRRVELVIARSAPIMEALQALVSRSPALADEATEGPRRLLIASDLLQNSAAVSVYKGHPWDDFAASPDFERLARNLHGIEVEVLRIPRADPAVRDQADVEHFWVRYFDRQGASIRRTLTIGDL